jgi:hypothetical protein
MMNERKVTHHTAATATANGETMNLTGIGQVAVQISGVFVGTVTFEATVDQSNWAAVEAINTATGAKATTATATGIYVIPVAAYRLFRARLTWTSGTSITVVGLGVEEGAGLSTADVDSTSSIPAGSNNIGDVDIASVTPHPVTPIVTVYSPTGTAYMKVTPNAANRTMFVRPRTVTQSLVYAPLVTHKIADTTTTIGAADPGAADLPANITAADEILADCNTHIASTVYHLAAGTAFYHCHKAADATNTSDSTDVGDSDLPGGYTMYTELKADLIAHAASVVFHKAAVAVLALPGVPNSESLLVAATNALRLAMIAHLPSTAAHSIADYENNRIITALAADATDTAGCKTNLNAIHDCWNSHCGIGAAAHADLPAVIAGANAAQAGILAHMYDATVAHGGTADLVQSALLAAGTTATNLATAAALLHLAKDIYNAHCAILDGGAYVTAGPVGLPIEWPCLGSFWCKTDTSSGVFTTSEFRSA